MLYSQLALLALIWIEINRIFRALLERAQLLSRKALALHANDHGFNPAILSIIFGSYFLIITKTYYA